MNRVVKHKVVCEKAINPSTLLSTENVHMKKPHSNYLLKIQEQICCLEEVSQIPQPVAESQS